ALAGCNLVLLIVDATQRQRAIDPFVLDMVRRTKTPVFLLLNKIDLIDKRDLLPLINEFRKLHDFREIIPISALKGQGLDVLMDRLVEALPEGPHYFPDDEITDQPARFMAAEIIRERVLLATGEEVPYATTVVIDQ